MKQIPLTQGKFALVDDDMFDYLNQWKWHARKTVYGTYMAGRQDYSNGQKTILMHREIMNALKGEDVDHRNHETLDNYRRNLRLCTRMQNKQNGKAHRNSSSRFKGVCWNKSNKNWRAYIRINCKLYHLGYFNSEIEAAKAYNEAEMKYFGEFAYNQAI